MIRYVLYLAVLVGLLISPSVFSATPVSGCVAWNGSYVCNGRSAGVSMAGAVADEQCVSQGAGYTCIEARYQLDEKIRPDDPFHGELRYYMRLVYGTDPPFNRLPNQFVYYCADGTSWNGSICAPKECSPDDPPLTGGFMKYEGSEPGYQTCADGCEYNPSSMTYQTGTVDGIKFVSLAGWIPSGANCTVGPNDGYVPPSDADSDGVSDEHDADPNNPGNSNQKDDPSKPKGETKEEGDGSGNGNQSSGGGNCQQAPNSSGDAILAQIAYQAWATRCAIEGLKDADGNVKTTGGKDGGGGATSMTETNAILTAIKDLLKPIRDFISGVSDEVGGLDTDDGTGEDDVDSVWGEPSTNDDLNSAGLGWLRSCPELPTLTIGGYTGQVDNGTLCTVMQAVGALILLLAYFQAGLIIGRS